jgi:UTP--glucose-1-phosphate uridylyltransferase
VPIHKAVIPAAGYGTRFLPVTKAVPKELLPIVDRPTIQYIVEECVRAGLDDILLITSAGKSAIRDHFDRSLELESALQDKGKHDLLAQIRAIADLARIHAIRQGEMLGLGHAVLKARDHVGDDQSFAVLLGDDLIHPKIEFLERMVAAHEQTGRAVVALMEVPHDQVHLYGVADAKETDEPGVFEISRLVEKPPVQEAPSNLIIIGRYVLPGQIFEVLERTPKGRGGEIQLTDALQALASEEPIVGVRLDAGRYDAGDKLGYVRANVEFAAEHPEIGDDFLAWLREYVREQG